MQAQPLDRARLFRAANDAVQRQPSEMFSRITPENQRDVREADSVPPGDLDCQEEGRICRKGRRTTPVPCNRGRPRHLNSARNSRDYAIY